MLSLQNEKDASFGAGEGFQELGHGARLLRAVGYKPVGIDGGGVCVSESLGRVFGAAHGGMGEI